MTTDTERAAYVVHVHSYSIVAVVAGLVTAIAIFAVLLFFNYDHADHFDAIPNTRTESTNTGDAPN